MTTDRNTLKSILPRVLRRYACLALLYTVLIWIVPVSAIATDRYNISANEYRVLVFASAIPSLIAWLAAFIGYAKLHDYAAAIRDTREGESFRKLATGATWLAWSLPIPILTAQILNGISRADPDFHAEAIIISNLTAVFVPVIAFVLIGSAARALTASNGLTFSIKQARSIIAGFALGGLLYCYFTLNRFDHSSIIGTNNPYYMPLWLMIILIIIPYLYCWFTGILAAYEIAEVSKKAKGVLYRQPLQLMAIGLIVVVLGSIAYQYLYSASPRVGYLVLNYRVVLSSIFRLSIGVGFILMALGAIKLKRLEEI